MRDLIQQKVQEKEQNEMLWLLKPEQIDECYYVKEELREVKKDYPFQDVIFDADEEFDENVEDIVDEEAIGGEVDTMNRQMRVL